MRHYLESQLPLQPLQLQELQLLDAYPGTLGAEPRVLIFENVRVKCLLWVASRHCG